MKLKRFLSSVIALTLIGSLLMSVLAAEWYLEDGDVTISAGDSGQTVSQGDGAAVADDAPVIKQRDSSKATDNTITIKTTDDATANVTIEDVNISSSGDAIDVGSSSANITLEGDNKIYSESGSGLHVSDGDVTITGSGSLEAGNSDENSYSEDAKIGSHENEDMSGSIRITGDATVTVKRDSGHGDGASIGSGNGGDMSGSITIDGNASVDVISSFDGAGIGSGNGGKMSGDITIGGSAQVTAGSYDDGAGIGAGEYGSIAGSGKIIIRDSAKVTAIGENEGAGIGTGENRFMDGLIIIQDNAQVTAIAGENAAAIGSDDENDMRGTILILGSARITTGILLDDDIHFNYETKEIEYTLNENAIGYIGDGQDAYHESDNGHYVIGPDVTINGISGSDMEALKDYINMRLSGENHDGEPENLTRLDIRSENGEFTVTADGEGTVEKILYGGSETVPTAPGTYPVTCVVRLGEETVEFRIGTLVVPEPFDGAAQSAPRYRVTDKGGKDIAYKAEQAGGVLTITVDADFAVLTGKLSGISTLRTQGVEKIIFITKGTASAFMLSDLLEKGESNETYKLTHDAGAAVFTVGERMADVSGILIKP